MEALVVNIGNTHLSAAHFSREGKLTRRLSFAKEVDPSEVKWQFPQTENIILGSVVPDLNRNWVKEASQIISHRHPWSIANLYHQPEALGLDRLANAEALARELAPPYLVIDAGTAFTFSVVGKKDGQAAFLGGAICASPDVLLFGLHNRTSQLPALRFTPNSATALIGRSPEEALQSGAAHGTIALVEGMIQKISKELQIEKLPVVITGGVGEWLHNSIATTSTYRENLTLEGYYAVACKS